MPKSSGTKELQLVDNTVSSAVHDDEEYDDEADEDSAETGSRDGRNSGESTTHSGEGDDDGKETNDEEAEGSNSQLPSFVKTLGSPVQATTMDRPPVKALPGRAKTNFPSEHAASVTSRALVLRPPGTRGFFPLDLWQVLLRIVGFNQAAARRAVHSAKKKNGTPANLMIV